MMLESDEYALSIFEKFIDDLNDLMNEQLNRLKVTMTEMQQGEKKLSQKKKQNDQLIELQKQQNEDLMNAKHDFEMKIEGLKRETLSRQQETDSLKQVKEMEAKNLKKNHDRQIKDKDDELKILDKEKAVQEQQYLQSQGRVSVLDSEKRKEVSSLQNEIKKLEEDIDTLKTQMKNKENNPQFMQVNNFFGEVRDYILEYKKICSDQEDAKKQRQRVFQAQKQLNDMEYRVNQNELKLKKVNDEELRKKREALEKVFEDTLGQIDSEKIKVQQLQDKKQLHE